MTIAIGMYKTRALAVREQNDTVRIRERSPTFKRRIDTERRVLP